MLDCMHSHHHHPKLPKKSVWIMLLCCLAPLFAMVALSSFGIIGGFLALILLCPILHLFIMRALYHDQIQHLENQRGKEGGRQ